MADQEDQSSRTEDPTEKRLRDARRKGDVPTSREVGTAMAVFSLFLLSVFLLPETGPGLIAALRGLVDGAGRVEIGVGEQGLADIGAVSGVMMGQVARVLAPLFTVMILGALAGVLIQGETVVAPERLRPKWSKISPAAGMKRLFSADTLVEFAKNFAKVGIVAVIALVVTRRTVTGMWTGPLFVPEALPAYVGQAASQMLIAATVFLVPVAIIDILWKRSQWLKKQRMSLREVRDEHKEIEGDPQMKARRAEKRRLRARRRITVSVPTASVILTNPTHYAVALRYDPAVDAAPVCVAKGADRIAARIREIGREHEIPVVENRPLARALHATVEVDESIPVEHWQAVAEIIGYVMDLRRNVRRKPPVGSELRDEA